MEEPDLEHSRYVTLWQVHSPLNQKRRSGLVNRRTRKASWQLASGQQLLKGPIRRPGTATVEVQQALQSILRFLQTDAFAQGEFCTRKTSFKHVIRVKPQAVWSSKEPSWPETCNYCCVWQPLFMPKLLLQSRCKYSKSCEVKLVCDPARPASHAISLRAGGNAVMTAQQWAGHAPLPDQATLVIAATQGFFKSLAAERSLGNTISFKLTTPLQASFPSLSWNASRFHFSIFGICDLDIALLDLNTQRRGFRFDFTCF